MALEATFNLLTTQLHALLEALTYLHTTVVEDQPQDDRSPQATPALVDIVGTTAEDLIGWMMEAIAAAQEAQQCIYTSDMDAVRRALSACQERTTRIGQCLVAELMQYERIADLARVGRTRGGEWRGWAMSAKQAIDSCRQPLFDLQQAQFECWQELAERSARQSISVQSTTVGQQFAMPDVRRGGRV
jgi:hypothetical protein